MPNVSLLKPNTAGAAILAINSSPESTISSTQAGTSVKMFMKLQSANISTGTTVVETTGDSDAVKHFEHNEMLQGQASLTGFVISKQRIGLSELRTSNNPISVALFLGIGSNLAGDSDEDKYLNFKMVVQQLNIQYRRTGAFIGISLSGPLTDGYNTGGDNVQPIIETTTPVVATS
tara:strand:- start:493 stop:1020 length:528 start_codon:yes stop_codon:yes gene_type:complete